MVSRSIQIAARTKADRKLSLCDAISTRRQFLSDGKQNLAVFVPSFAEALSKFMEIQRVLALASPNNVVGGLPLQKIRELRGLFAIVKKLIERDFKCPSELFQGLDSWNRVAVFNAGYVTAKQSCSLFDVSLREILALAQFSQSVADHHFLCLLVGTIC
jgi:hypothetical protein